MLRALLTTLNEPQPNRKLRGSHAAGPRVDPIETRLIEALSSLQARPKFRELLSTPNDYHQTLAHLSILYDYPSLLDRLVKWHIDLAIADVNGLTALHCAYMKGDLDSVHILKRGGASGIVTDRLGRTPSELQPEGLKGLDLGIDPETELVGSDAEIYAETDDIDIDEQLTIGKQCCALNLDNGIDSGRSQLGSANNISEDKEPDSTVAGSDEGDNGGVAKESGSSTSNCGSAQIASRSKDPEINHLKAASQASRPEMWVVDVCGIPQITSSSKGPMVNDLPPLQPTVPSMMLRRDKWLIDIKTLELYLQERWYLNQEMEPLTWNGKSILWKWLNQVEIEGRYKYSCCVPLQEDQWCTYMTHCLDCAIAHVRGHLGHNPYPCEGMCGNQHWYA